MLVIGTDVRTDLDSVGQKLRACQIHEGNPLEDDPWPEGEVPAPVVTAIPVCYVQGVYEKYFPHGAHVQLRFFPGAPGTPEGWLVGSAYVKQLYESPWKTPSESPFEGLPSGPRSALAAATSTSGQAWPGTNEESTPAVEQPADAGLDAARSGVGRSWGTAKAGEGRDCAGGHHGVTPSSWACCGAGVRATRARA